MLPAFIFAGAAPLIRADLGFEARYVGVVAALYFATSSAASFHAGRLGERLGSQRTMWLGIGISATVLVGIGTVARDLVTLAVLMAVAGLGNATIQPAANLALARGVGEHRRGFAFGCKQAAIPIASAIGGFAVPTVGVIYGWRVVYLGAAVLALFAVWLPLPDRTRPGVMGPLPRLGVADPSLWFLTLGIGLGSAAANAMGAYLVEAATSVGWEAGQAGTILGIGSACGIVARLGVGWWSDTVTSGRLRVVAGMMAVGAIGYALLVWLDQPLVLVAALPLAFAAGWGYNGLFLYSVVRLYPDTPASATGFTQVGAFGGAVLGPPLFGVVADVAGYTQAWSMLAVMSALGAVSIVAARRRVLDPAPRSR